MRQNKSGLIIMILVIIVVLLLAIVAYALLIKPGFDKYIFEKQREMYNQGVSDTITFMFSEIQQKGYTQIFANNQTLILAPVQVEQPTE